MNGAFSWMCLQCGRPCFLLNTVYTPHSCPSVREGKTKTVKWQRLDDRTLDKHKHPIATLIKLCPEWVNSIVKEHLEK